MGGGAYLPRGGAAPGAAASARRAVERGQGAAWNRLCSAAEDAAWAGSLARRAPLAGLPVLATLRCGAWYVAQPDGTCHFKSTDGHHGRWDVPLARLNLPAARLAARHGGLVIVDATRRGKRFPDALSKTVPLWAAVLNRVAYRLRVPGAAAVAEGDQEGEGGWDSELHTPLWVPAQERAQMEALLEGLVDRALGVGAASLREALKGLRRPLRPLWLSPESRLSLTEDDGEAGAAGGNGGIGACTREAALRAFTPLYLVSASRVAALHEARVPEGARWTWDYVQGAGDDAEHWAEGLTPEGFWAHRELLLGPGPAGLGARIAELVALLGKGGGPGLTVAGTHRYAAAGCGEAVADLVTRGEDGVFWIRGTGLGLGDAAAGAAPRAADAILNCGLDTPEGIAAAAASGGRALHLPVRHYKERRGPQLSSVLPAALEACRKWLGEGLRVLVHCDDGRDVCVCVAVVVLLGLYAPIADGELCLDQSALQSPLRAADKGRVRQVLAYVSAAYPPAQASRGMLKQVYEFFREPHGPESLPTD